MPPRRVKSTQKPAGPLARRRQRASAVNPAWHQAACYGRRDAGDLSALNPYPYGSQCWIIYEQARRAARLR